jgi:hypothetical protein
MLLVPIVVEDDLIYFFVESSEALFGFFAATVFFSGTADEVGEKYDKGRHRYLANK